MIWETINLFSKDESTGDSKKVLSMNIEEWGASIRPSARRGNILQRSEGLIPCMADVTVMPGADHKSVHSDGQSQVDVMIWEYQQLLCLPMETHVCCWIINGRLRRKLYFRQSRMKWNWWCWLSRFTTQRLRSSPGRTPASVHICLRDIKPHMRSKDS